MRWESDLTNHGIRFLDQAIFTQDSTACPTKKTAVRKYYTQLHYMLY